MAKTIAAFINQSITDYGYGIICIISTMFPTTTTVETITAPKTTTTMLSTAGNYSNVHVHGGPKIGTIIYALILPDINRLSTLFYCQNQEKFVIILSLKIPSHLKCVATLPCEMSSVCRSVSLIVPLVNEHLM